MNRGVKAGRAWCDANEVGYRRGPDYPVEIHTAQTSLRFTEEVKGYADFGGNEQGCAEESYVEVQMAVHVEGVNRFITWPEHQASIEGVVISDHLGGRLPIRRGTFNIFVDEGDPARKKVIYRIFFDDVQGHPLTLSGLKDLYDDPGMDFMSDTTRVLAKIYRGTVADDEEETADVVATGILRVGMLDFLKQLATLRAEGPTPTDRTSALTRFGVFYFGRLWDVYARSLLPSGPF